MEATRTTAYRSNSNARIMTIKRMEATHTAAYGSNSNDSNKQLTSEWGQLIPTRLEATRMLRLLISNE